MMQIERMQSPPASCATIGTLIVSATNAAGATASGGGPMSAATLDKIHRGAVALLGQTDWPGIEHRIEDAHQNRWQYGAIYPSHVALGLVIDAVQKSAEKHHVTLSENNLGQALGLFPELLSHPTFSDTSDIFPPADQHRTVNWVPLRERMPKQVGIRETAVRLSHNLHADEIAQAHGQLEQLCDSHPSFQHITGPRRKQFIVDKASIDMAKTVVGMADGPLAIALYEGGGLDEKSYAFPLMQGWHKMLASLENDPKTNAIPPFTPKLIRELHDIFSEENYGLGHGFDDCGIMYENVYTEAGERFHKEFLKELKDNFSVEADFERDGMPQKQVAGQPTLHSTAYFRDANYGAKPEKIVAALISDYEKQVKDTHGDQDKTLLAIATFCLKLAHLHPFPNGNHRTFGMLALNRCLIEHGFPAVALPSSIEFFGVTPEEAVKLLRPQTHPA